MQANFLFRKPRNLAVITTAEVMAEGKPILFVSHDEEDGGWQFHSGKEVDIHQAMVVSLANIVQYDASVNELADLPPGWVARREQAGAVWIAERAERE